MEIWLTVAWELLSNPQNNLSTSQKMIEDIVTNTESKRNKLTSLLFFVF